MFDVHIDCLFYEKLVGELEFFKICMHEYIFIFLRIMNGLFLWSYWMCFENLWQVVIKSSILYLVRSKEQSYCS